MTTVKKMLGKSEKYIERINKRTKLKLPLYSLGEEIFSAISHGIPALISIAGLVLALVFCRKEAEVVTGLSIFGGCMIILYTVSTLYHALGINKAKKVFQILDHCAIFLLIAGTYTPITLLCLDFVTGIVMLSVIWTCAIVGITLVSIDMKRFEKFSMVCYLVMGWMIVFVIGSFIENAGFYPFVFLISGGAMYTFGAVLYGIGKKKSYVHGVWHIFVFLGSVCHYLAVIIISL